MIIVAASILGLLLGSMLSVLLARWPQFEGFVSGRSHCPHCKHELGARDLIPLVSWVLSRGRCRYCHAKISSLYPFLELTVGGLFGAYAALYGVPTGWYAIEYLILFGLIALFFFDLQYQVLPDVILAPLFVVAVARLGYYRPDVLLSAGATGVLLASSLGLLYIISRGRWLGLGDVKLAAVIGVLFGFPVAIGVTLIAIWSGALIGLLMIARRQATMKTALPFGSFWTAAAILALMIPEPVAFLSGLFIPVVQ